jgi:hypothetical protein
MTDNKGFLYENTINDKLLKYGLGTGQGAGSDSNAPDAVLILGNSKHKIEIKLDLAVDFGQGSLDYDLKKKKWILGGAKTTSAQQMREFLTVVKVPQLVQREWGDAGPPRKFTVPTSQFKQKDVNFDYQHFTDRYVPIPNTAVANYYNSKKTYYIQIGGYGLYHMGRDVAKLDTPEFNLQLRLRIRLKRGGSNPIYNYRFTTAIQAVKGSLKKSSCDLSNDDFLKAIKARSS